MDKYLKNIKTQFLLSKNVKPALEQMMVVLL